MLPSSLSNAKIVGLDFVNADNDTISSVATPVPDGTFAPQLDKLPEQS